jgi:hypothetical protein
VSCFLCEHYVPQEAKWGQISTGSAHANDMYCNIEQLLDLALASVIQHFEFDEATGISTALGRKTLDSELAQDPTSPVKLLGDTLKAAAVLWSARNFDAAIAGFTTALSKLHEMEGDPAARSLIEARLYRQMVRHTVRCLRYLRCLRCPRCCVPARALGL